MAVHNNWNDLVRAAQAACTSILENEVSKVTEEIVNRHIQTDIYGAYSPVGSAMGGYDRRGALGDPGNTVSKMIEKDTLLVTNEAPPSPSLFGDGSDGDYPDELLYWIENGLVPNMFNGNNYPWMFPRPAIANSQAEINSGPEVRDAISRGMKRVFGK